MIAALIAAGALTTKVTVPATLALMLFSAVLEVYDEMAKELGLAMNPEDYVA
ncbi:MAG: hypothetical protein FWE41_04590 [Coriobacteriia bacterium]|nr:hypothetical protein [Coriobacteriia bacterium]MCL2750768.1 hypothetical protein [Coriobacteriia bacterium]